MFVLSYTQKPRKQKEPFALLLATLYQPASVSKYENLDETRPLESEVDESS